MVQIKVENFINVTKVRVHFFNGRIVLEQAQDLQTVLNFK
jgi:hypothetical protein